MKMLLMAIALSTLFLIVSCGGKNEEKPQQEVQQVEAQTNQNQTTETPQTETSTPETNSNTTTSLPQAEIKSADEPVVERIDMTNSPLTGTVISINGVAAGNSGALKASEAGNAYDKGQVLGFKSGEQIYIVYNEDGTFAGKRLHKLIGKTIKIKGEIKKIDDLQILIATSIE